MVSQEHPLSCGAACARQLLADADIVVTEAKVRDLAGFHDEIGIYADLLGDAMTELNPRQPYRGVSVDPSSLPALLERAPFLAMIHAHWIIVDGATESGSLAARDPAPLVTSSSLGTEGVMERRVFDAAWARGMYQVVYKV